MNNNSKPLRVLCLSQRFLFPMDTGGKIRTGKILEQLKNHFSVTVISNVERPKDEPYLGEMRRLCDKFVPVPWVEVKRFTPRFYWKIFKQSFSRYPISMLNDYSPELEAAILDELASEPYDMAICDFLQSTLNFTKVRDIPLALFQHNVETTIAKRHLEKSKDPVSKLFWELQYRKMFHHERAMCHRFNGIIAVSEQDKARMERWFGAKNVHAIPTGVDTDYYLPRPDLPQKSQLVFVGGMDWLPNEDAMFFFIRQIFPLIQKEIPGVKLKIVGRNPSPRFLKFIEQNQDIEATGWVADTRPHIAESAVCVVPIRIGGGTRMKIYEAMAMGKAVVSTTVGAEGLPLAHGEQILLADDPKMFADQVTRLLKHPNERRNLEGNARRYVHENFRWEKVAEVFVEICTQLVGKPSHSIPLSCV